MSNIVIFGITGYSGTHIANELLERGHSVTGVGRDPADAAPRQNLEVLAGSVYDSEFVAKAVQGADAVVIAIRSLQADGLELAERYRNCSRQPREALARLGVVGGAASLYVAEGGPLVIDAGFPEGYRAEAEAHARGRDAEECRHAIRLVLRQPARELRQSQPGNPDRQVPAGHRCPPRNPGRQDRDLRPDFAIALADEIEKRPTTRPHYLGY